MTQKTVSLTDLNTANEDVLAQKLQISVRLAKRIIALRPYQSIDQLDKVWGIDPAILHRITMLVSDSPRELGSDLTVKEVLPLRQIATLPVASEYKIIPQRKEKEQAESPSSLSLSPKADKTSWKTSLLLVLILLAGAYFRFIGLNWDDGQHQHPDERYISMVVDQIDDVNGVDEYFNTLNSPLNPLRFGSYTYGMFPLFFTRMVAEWVGMGDYDSITVAGRAMSGVFDLLAVWMLYLLGKRLYDRRIGLLAAALGAAAVLPIQLSHYFTVDSFSTVFVIAGFYFAIQAIPIHDPDGKFSWST